MQYLLGDGFARSWAMMKEHRQFYDICMGERYRLTGWSQLLDARNLVRPNHGPTCETLLNICPWWSELT
jgi:hypothetical protein